MNRRWREQQHLGIDESPDKGYGADGQPAAGIQGTDTLVFVVDILGAA